MESKIFVFFIALLCWFDHLSRVEGTCVKLENYELEILNNSVVIPGEFGKNWYKSVQWIQKPSDDIMFSFRRHLWSKDWISQSGARLSLCDKRCWSGEAEEIDVVEIIRELLGIRGGCDVAVEEKETDDDFFGSSSPCRPITFLYGSDNHKQRIIVDLKYKHEQIMSGQLIIPARVYKD